MSDTARPAFNVVEPFDGILIVQMNGPMRDLLRDFIFEFDEIDTEMYALAEALTDPRRWFRRATGAAFSTERFESVTSVHLNQYMCRTIRDFIDQCDGHLERELLALSKAIANPEQCYRLRKAKQTADKYQFVGSDA